MGVREITPAVVRTWLAALKDEGMSSRTVNRKISALRSFYKFQLRMGGVEQSPMTAIIAPKAGKRLPVFVEQMMTLHRVASQGMGHGLSPDSDAAALDAALRRLVDDSVCRQHAANFGRSYNGYTPDIALDAVVEGIEDLLA